MKKSFLAVTLIILCCFAQALESRAANLPMTAGIEWTDGRFIPMQNGSPMISFDEQNRPKLDLRGAWKKKRLRVNHDFSLSPRDAAWFELVEQESAGAIAADFDDSAWATHQLPGVENAMPAAPESAAGAEVYDRGVYYRRRFDVDANWEGKVVRFIALSADYVADLWINGHWVGYHEGGYGPFSFDVSDYLNYGGNNTAVIRVDAMPWLIRFDITPTWFATDWMHYVGVAQDIYLSACAPANVVRADVIPKNTSGDLDVSVVIENRGDGARRPKAALSIFAMDDTHPDYLTDPIAENLIGQSVEVGGNVIKSISLDAGEYRALTFDIEIPDPVLWTPREPNLYVLKVDLYESDLLVDTFSTQFGVRTIEVGRDAKMLLNRRPAFFTGMARHEDWPDTGRTATMEKIRDDLQIIKDTNVRFLRTAHYPNHPDTYILTDRMGFAVWEEIPAWWINQVTIPILMNRGLTKQMWREMIWTGRNRPSILLWSLCNEPMWYLAFNLRQYVRDLHSDLDDNYPDGRLVTQSLAADGAVLTGGAQEDVDVAGWTMYFGVFYDDDIVRDSQDFLYWQNNVYPSQPIIVTEYGYWSGSDDGEAADQLDITSKDLDAFLPLAAVDENGEATGGFLAAVAYWCQFNWYRVQDPHIQSMGLMHMDRETAKPAHGEVLERYQPYFDMGGLADPVDYIDEDDDDVDDDSGDDDDDDDDSGDLSAQSSNDDDDDDGCGC